MTYCSLRAVGVVPMARRSLRRHVPLHAVDRGDRAPRVQSGERLVSVVLPTYNGVDDGLEELLRSLRQQVGVRVEILAVDSSSTDGTRELLRRYDARVTTIPQADFHHARTRNLGASRASGEMLLFTVQDAIFRDPRWIETGLHTVDRFKAVSYSTPQLPKPGASLLARYLSYNFLRNLYPSGISVIGGGSSSALAWKALTLRGAKEEMLHIDDTNHLVSRRYFEGVGGFEGSTCEDMEFARKVVQRGQRFVFSTLSAIQHSHDYRDIARYARRVFVDNCRIADLVGDRGRRPGRSGLVESILLVGSVLMSSFDRSVAGFVEAGFDRVSFVMATQEMARTVHFTEVERAFVMSVEALLAAPADSFLGQASLTPSVQALLDASQVSLDEVRETGQWRGSLRAMLRVAGSGKAHLANAARLIETATQTTVEPIEEFRHFGLGVLMNTTMFWASRAVLDDPRSEASKVMASWTWG